MDQPEETPLAMTARHVAEFEQRVNKQAAFVARLQATGNPVLAEHQRLLAEGFLVSAERLLAAFQRSLVLARDHLRIEQERHGKAP